MACEMPYMMLIELEFGAQGRIVVLETRSSCSGRSDLIHRFAGRAAAENGSARRQISEFTTISFTTGGCCARISRAAKRPRECREVEKSASPVRVDTPSEWGETDGIFCVVDVTKIPFPLMDFVAVRLFPALRERPVLGHRRPGRSNQRLRHRLDRRMSSA